MGKLYCLYLTFDCIREEALKYETRTNFKKGNPKYYNYALTHYIMDDICKHMKPLGIKWSYDLCKKEALKYNTKKEFYSNSSSAYNYSRKINVLDELCSHMKVLNIKWTNELAREEALKYETLKDLININESVYRYAIRNNILDDICSHMKVTGSKYKRCIYVCYFPDNHCYIGLTFDIDKRMTDRIRDTTDAVTIHKMDTGLEYKYKMLTDYVDVNEASKLEGVYVDEYESKGWIILNRTTTGGIGGVSKWSYDLCKEEALKYNTRGEYSKCCSSYNYARVNGILDDICSHMKSGLGKWSYDLCKKESLKYNKRSHFKNGNSGAYRYALKHKFMDDLFLKGS